SSVMGSSKDFMEPFTYMLPPGWTFGDDDPGWFRLDAPSSEAPGTEFYALRNVQATRPDCSNLPKQDVGTSSDAMTRWFSRHPALDATTPRPITLGAASGSWVDLTLAPDWEQTCTDGLGLLTNPKGGQSWAIYNTEKMRFYVL